jgi:hypothetical protein
VVLTVATDGAPMYVTERDKVLARDFAARFDRVDAAEVFARYVLSGAPEEQRLLDLTPADRRRIFNLGYFTWVEQQGVGFDPFVARREPDFARAADDRAGLGRAHRDFNGEPGPGAGVSGGRLPTTGPDAAGVRPPSITFACGWLPGVDDRSPDALPAPGRTTTSTTS